MECSDTFDSFDGPRGPSEVSSLDRYYLSPLDSCTPRSIEGLVHFMQPLLEQFSEATGWKLTLLAGGPEPVRDGQLGVIR